MYTSCVRKLLLLLWLSAQEQVYGSPSGAPDLACDKLTPGHPTPTAVGQPHFKVSLSQSRYKPGDKIHATFERTDGNPFKGFLIQVRRKQDTDNEKIGSFTILDKNFTRHNCPTFCTKWSNCSVTHTNNKDKHRVSFIWQAPCSFEGDVTIRATFVQSFSPSIYWRDIHLMDLIADPGTGDECKNYSKGGTGGAVIDIPLVTPEPISLSGCGSTKGCFKTPHLCKGIEDCDYILTWIVSKGDQVEFEISSKAPDSIKWTALGLSLDRKMGLDSVTDCIYNESSHTMIIQSSWNTDKPNNKVLQNKELGIVPGTTKGSYVNGVLHCFFTRYIHNEEAVTDNVVISSVKINKVYNLDRSLYLLLAAGPGSKGIKFPHITTTEISEVDVNLSSTNYLKLEAESINPLIIAHGSMMIFSWIVFASVGVLIPRYFKTTFKDEVLGKATWFQIHRTLMSFVVILTCCGFIIIFVKVGGYSSNLVKVEAAHPILGIIVICLVIINPIAALLRPDIDSPRRQLFYIFHFTVGTFTHVSAVSTVFVATLMSQTEMSTWSKWVVVGFAVWYCFVEVILAINQGCLKSKDDTKTRNDSDITTTEDSALINNSNQAEKSKSIFKVGVICIHFGVLLTCAVILVLDLAQYI